MRSQPVRRAAKAGTWYPGDARVLGSAIDGYCADVRERVSGEISALIAPHAGLVYSGPVAAHAYAQLAGRAYEAVVLVGPSHYVAFDGVAVVRRGLFETPLGTIAIDETLADQMMAVTPVIHERPSAHDREHSLELHLPFLQRLLPGLPIVPLVMGAQVPATVHALSVALAQVGADRRILLVASSDLSHFFDARRAATLDGTIIDAINRFDPDALEAALAVFPDHACGGGPMVAVMQAARACGAQDARVLCHRTSGDVSGDMHEVVGYVAAVLGSFASDEIPGRVP